MTRYSHLAAIILSAIAITACTGHSQEKVELGADSIMPVSDHQVDSTIYKMGIKAAHELMDAVRDTSDFNSALLDIQARIHLIRTRVDAEAAADYSKGFTDGVSVRCDSLGRKLQ